MSCIHVSDQPEARSSRGGKIVAHDKAGLMDGSEVCVWSTIKDLWCIQTAFPA